MAAVTPQYLLDERADVVNFMNTLENITVKEVLDHFRTDRSTPRGKRISAIINTGVNRGHLEITSKGKYKKVSIMPTDMKILVVKKKPKDE